MDHSDWHERWASGQTGWHRAGPHELLMEHGSPQDWKRVLVPLCGASHDLGWLVDQGVEVVGIELSPVAGARVFEDRGVAPAENTTDSFTMLTAGGLTVAVGDFFAANPDDLGVFDAVWDRAALVAIDPESRRAYVETLTRVAPGADLLLAVFDYDPSLKEGPPHSVPADHVSELYADVELLAVDDLSEEFAARGLQGQFLRKLYRGRIPG